MGAFLAGLGAAAVASSPQLVNMATSLINSGRADYWHKKDQKHNDKLQNTEIQRRVEDAQSAGINPYDAIGAGAGAGSSTLAHSGAGGLDLGNVNPGSWLDFSIAKEKLKQEKDISKIVNNQMQGSYYDRKLKGLMSDFLTGYDTSFVYDKDGRAVNKFSDSYVSPDDWSKRIEESPYLQDFVSKLNASKYSTAMLGKQNDWFNTNQVLDAINSGTGSVGNVASAFYGGFGSYRNYQGGKYFKAQRGYFEPEFTYPKHEMGFHP